MGSKKNSSIPKLLRNEIKQTNGLKTKTNGKRAKTPKAWIAKQEIVKNNLFLNKWFWRLIQLDSSFVGKHKVNAEKGKVA